MTERHEVVVVASIAWTERTAHLDVYQRTPPWILPRKDEPYTPEQQHRSADDPEEALAHPRGLHDMYEQNTSFVPVRGPRRRRHRGGRPCTRQCNATTSTW